MSIANTNSVRSKTDSTYSFKNFGPTKLPVKPVASASPLIDDTVSISDEAKVLFGINNYSQEELGAMLENHKTATDDSNSPLKTQLLCFKIAMRIISGDNVPNKDKVFLAENEPGMFSRAMLLRRQNKDPKDYKSLLGNEKSKDSDDTSSPISSASSKNTTVESVSADAAEISVDIEA